MAKRITDQELEKIILDKCNEKGLIYSRFERTGRLDYSNVFLICIGCNKEYCISYKSLLNNYENKFCFKCLEENLNRNIENSMKLKEFSFVRDDIEKNNKLGVISGLHKNLIVNCKNGHNFSIRTDSLLRGDGCPLCTKENKKNLSINNLLKKSLSRGYEYLGYSEEWLGKETIVNFRCPVGHNFSTRYRSFMFNNSGCPYCNNNYHLEKEIENILMNNHYNYIPQWKSNWLIFYKKLSLDFYIPNYNLAIECQGIQHFQPVDWFGGNITYNNIKNRDLLKYNLCKEHGITILYYTNVPQSKINFFAPVYTDINELLNEIKKYIN